MTVQEIANRLVELCREGKYVQAQKELYADNVKSIEPIEPKITEGLVNTLGKLEYFANAFETHSIEVSEPLVAGSFFSCNMTLDSTNKATGDRNTMAELCVYEVKDGKITLEQFFYPAH